MIGVKVRGDMAGKTVVLFAKILGRALLWIKALDAHTEGPIHFLPVTKP